ncbi:copper resistance CopC family protein [Actinoplanes sp. CA-142083]|uniref:copper resistance CopC family protein n=1 Tax=Actinoplanes sp. CA-142083 TaxID=3239903 RepID=UPI003D8EC6A8
MFRRILVAAAALAVVAPAAPAWAHNSLVESSPAANARLSTAPKQVKLRFLQRLSPAGTVIVLVDAAKRRVPTSAPALAGATGAVTIGRKLANGTYNVAYRVASRDGHVVRGSHGFTVAG